MEIWHKIDVITCGNKSWALLQVSKWRLQKGKVHKICDFSWRTNVRWVNRTEIPNGNVSKIQKNKTVTSFWQLIVFAMNFEQLSISYLVTSSEIQFPDVFWLAEFYVYLVQVHFRSKLEVFCCTIQCHYAQVKLLLFGIMNFTITFIVI